MNRNESLARMAAAVGNSAAAGDPLVLAKSFITALQGLVSSWEEDDSFDAEFMSMIDQF